MLILLFYVYFHVHGYVDSYFYFQFYVDIYFYFNVMFNFCIYSVLFLL